MTVAVMLVTNPPKESGLPPAIVIWVLFSTNPRGDRFRTG